MLKKIGFALLCVVSACVTQAYATTNHVFTQGPAVEYELLPNDPQVFSNVFFWGIKATCTIISDVPNNVIAVKMLRKTGSVNDIQLNAGDGMTLLFQPNDKLYIYAESGAKVELMNLGDITIRASCAAG